MNDRKRTSAKVRTQPAKAVFAQWRKDPDYIREYEALEDEFAIMEALVRARAEAGMSQIQIAQKMNTTQPAVARLEGGAHRASLKSLRSYAAATGHRLRISLEPLARKS